MQCPRNFQRLMDKVLADYLGKFAVVYIDDINVYSRTFPEHLDHLRKVFNKLEEAGLKINLEKCTFFQPEIHFLGHVVGRSGIRPDESKIEKVRTFPIPRTV